MSEPCESGLRERIANLERELEEAREEINHPRNRPSIETIGHQVKNHHAEANLNQYGRAADVVFIDPEKEQKEHHQRRISNPTQYGRFHRFLHRYNFHEFTQRPILHQWVYNGTIYREAKERVSSRFELFFDLLFVGIIHQLAETTAEHPTGTGLAKYVLTFCPAYSIWSDVRDIVNQFANDDVTQRSYILWIMILLVGYANNAASVELVKIGETQPPENMAALRWTIGFFVVAKISKVLLNTFHGYWLPMSRIPLFAQSLNSFGVGLLFFICIFLPPLAGYIVISIAILGEYAIKIVGVILLKMVELKKARSQAASRTTTMSVSEKSSGDDMPDKELEGGVVERVEEEFDGQIEKARKAYKFPAINIEHHVDRLGAFVTIILGEMVVNVFYHTSRASGLNQQSGRSILGLMVAFNLNWIYFDSEACRNFIHAIRRHWLTGFIFTMMHLPLTLSLLLASAAMNRLVVSVVEPSTSSSSAEVHARAESPGPSSGAGADASHVSTIPTGIYYFFGTGVGLSIICMAIIGMMHRSLDNCKPHGVLGLSRAFVIGTRLVMGLVMMLLPIAHERFTPLSMLGIYVALTAALIMEETFSRVERVERESNDERKADEDAGSSTT